MEYGFVQQALLSLASAEVSNVVLGALMKRKARTEGREQSNREWREWLRRKENAERKGEPFNEPAPDGMPAETLIDSEHPGG